MSHRHDLKLGVAGWLVLLTVPAVSHAQGHSVPGVEAALRSATKSDRDLKAFYAARGNRPLWLEGAALSSAGVSLMRMIAGADLDGIDPAYFEWDTVGRSVERAENGSPKTVARADIALSRAFVRYAMATRHPRDVGTVYLNHELEPRTPAGGALLAAAAAAPSLSDHVTSMRWMNPIYADLRRALAEQVGVSHAGGEQARPPQVLLPSGPTLKPGSSGDRVRALRQRLGMSPFGAFDGAVAAALSEFQAGRGIPADGVAGPRTIAALNDTPQDTERLIRVNMDRARVLPADPTRRYILVDAAAARLWMYENGRVQGSMKVVVGKPDQQTPMLAGLLHYALVNPYWNVPPDLARTKVAPAVIKKGVGYLKTMRYEVLSDWSDAARVVSPRTVDWASVAAGRQEIRVRQLPGRDNSMGQMKFVMPNDLGIYLHDTPDRALFKEPNRYFSSGCVRLEDAPRLAKWLFGHPLIATSRAPEQRVELPEPVPVYITYLTAAPNINGLIFRADAYGRDRAGLVLPDRRVAARGDAR